MILKGDREVQAMKEEIKTLLKVYKDLKKGNEVVLGESDNQFIKGKLAAIDYIIEDLEELLGDKDDL